MPQVILDGLCWQRFDRGITLWLVVFLFGLALAASLGVSSFVINEVQQTRVITDSVGAFFAANAGVEQALYQLCKQGDRSDQLNQPVGAGTYSYTVRGGGNPVVVSTGFFRNSRRAVELTGFSAGGGRVDCGSSSGQTTADYGTGVDAFDQAKVVAGFNDLSVQSITSGRTLPDIVIFLILANIQAGESVIPVNGAPTGLAAGDEVLIMNLQRIGSTGSLGPVGEWETQYVSNVDAISQTVTLQSGLSRRYDGTKHRTILQRVPNYDSLAFAVGQQVGASGWDGSKGGVFFIRVANTLTVGTGAEITMVARGYRGGGPGLQGESRGGLGLVSTANNDGGGGGFGGVLNGGGGGAGYAASGTRGGTDPVSGGWGWGGDGGVAYGDSGLSRLLLGSGGGGGGGCASGRGGAGGGIVYVAASAISNSGVIRSSGSPGVGGCAMGSGESTWTGAGGGSGGSLFVQRSTAAVVGAVENLSGIGVVGNTGAACGADSFCEANRNKGGDGSIGRTLITP
ncbi:hypothetical protein HYW67_01770 [Candidatus Parcubacteria bacterium]|nr:hypothetical protein [Candidatus Parcubacteria bacterium]